MENKTPHSPVRSSFIKFVLTISCISLLVSACTARAIPTSTPLIATTGGSTTSEATQTTSVEPTASEAPLGAGIIYYVSTSGSDSNSGSATSPFKTLSKGVSVLKAGDTLYIKSGTYKLTSSLIVSTSGNTTTGPITISTAPGEPSLATITGDTNGDGKGETPSSIYSGLVELRGSYLRLQNVQITYSHGRGVKSGGKFNVISGSNINHSWESGVYIYGSDNRVENNKIWRNVDLNWCGGATGRQCNGNWPGGLAWGASHDSVAPGVAPRLVIRNNKVYNNSGEGLLCMHTDYATIEDNVVYENWALEIDLDQCSYTTVQKNLVYGTANKVWWKGSTRPSTGIMIANEGITDSNGNMYPIGHDRKIINNILVGNGTNFYFWKGTGNGPDLPNSALKNDLIAYNTLVNVGGSGGTSLKIEAGPHSNTRIFNNLVLETTYTIAYVPSTSGLKFSNNLWSKTPPSAIRSSTDVIANPLLADPNHTRTAGAVVPDWYKTTSSSPALTRALSITEVKVDYWNLTRPTTKPDIGADEVP